MDNTRMSRINRLIQKEVSDLFRIQTQSVPGTLITVTSVTVSPDLSIARVRLSIFPSEKIDDSLDYLERIDSLLGLNNK